MDNAKLKEKARKGLDKNKAPLILATFLLVGAGICCSFVGTLINTPWISFVLALIVDALFMLGFVKMVSKAARGKKVKLEQLLSQTDLFFKYILISIVLFVIMAILMLLAAIAFKSLAVVITYQVEINFVLSLILIVFGLLLEIVILFVLLYLSISFSQVLFIMNDEPNLSVGQVLSKSFEMMEDYIFDYFLLILSFIGWFILGIFTLGILYLWLIPYVMITCACFYDKIKKEYDKDKKISNLFNDEDAEEALKK